MPSRRFCMFCGSCGQERYYERAKTGTAMIAFLNLIFLFILTPSFIFAQEQQIGGKIIEHNLLDNKYFLSTPENYMQNHGQQDKYPLIIGLHGFGGQAKGFLSLWFYPAKGRGYFIACPQIEYRTDRRLNENFVKDMLNQITKEYPIDQRRIFLTGHSAGAHFSYYLYLKNSLLFTASAPVSGMLRDWVVPYMHNAKGLKFYLIQGTKDSTNTMSEFEGTLSILKANKADVIYETYEGGHEYPRNISDKIIDWFDTFK
ncbi:MAG: hypothetical protein AABZ65_00230 [Candidatus Omnitrophota bacterium]